MDFGVYPPEVNSGRMYAGPGAGPLLAAAQAWAVLADELSAASGTYESVVSGLTAGPWAGPASVSMTAAAAPYIAWMSTTAAHAEETAARATAAVAAYETAFAMTVPPPAVAANRSLLAALVASNFFGQNTAAIAAAETAYAEMWAQDAAAMYAYAASSAAATTLTPLVSPQPNAHPGAAAEVFSAVPAALHALAVPAQVIPAQSALDLVSNIIAVALDVPGSVIGLFGITPLAIVAGPVDLPFGIASYYSGIHTDDIVSDWNGEEGWPGTGPAPVKEFPATLLNLSPGTVPAASAALGTAETVGGLTVPSGWTVAAPEIRPLAVALPVTVDAIEAEWETGQEATLVAAQAEAGSSATLGDLGIAAMTGRALAPTEGGAAGGRPAAVAVLDGTPAARIVAPLGQDTPAGRTEARPGEPRVVVTGVAARIREITRLRDEGDLTDDEYAELKKGLLGC